MNNDTQLIWEAYSGITESGGVAIPLAKIKNTGQFALVKYGNNTHKIYNGDNLPIRAPRKHSLLIQQDSNVTSIHLLDEAGDSKVMQALSRANGRFDKVYTLFIDYNDIDGVMLTIR